MRLDSIGEFLFRKSNQNNLQPMCLTENMASLFIYLCIYLFVYIYHTSIHPCCLGNPKQRNVCHRDLKLENILLLRRSLDSPIRVADFGLSKQCLDPKETGEIEKGRGGKSKTITMTSSAWQLTARIVSLVGGGLKLSY